MYYWKSTSNRVDVVCRLWYILFMGFSRNRVYELYAWMRLISGVFFEYIHMCKFRNAYRYVSLTHIQESIEKYSKQTPLSTRFTAPRHYLDFDDGNQEEMESTAIYKKCKGAHTPQTTNEANTHMVTRARLISNLYAIKLL